MTRTETLTRASSPRVGDVFSGETFAVTVLEVNPRFVYLEGEAGELAIPFLKWPNVAAATLNAGAHFTPVEADE